METGRVRALLGACLLLGAIGVVASDESDPSAPRVVRGPYLQMASDDQVTVRWRTDQPTPTRIVWGPIPLELVDTVEDMTPRTEHEVRLAGLEADTKYAFTISLPDDTLAAPTEGSFQTAPAPGSTRPMRIWVQGDSGTANSLSAAVYDAYLEYTGETPTDVWLMLGDNAYPSGTDAEYQAAVFDHFPELLATTPLFSTLGNHDGYTASSNSLSGPYYDIFSLPAAGELGGLASGTEAYYSFDRGNVHFVVLNSWDIDRSPTGAMATWVDADLAATTQEWVVALWHHPPYSKGSHDSDTEARMVEMRETFVPILESHGVDLTLTGHSHSYERSLLIDGHHGDSSTFDAVHVIDGGDGDVAGDGFYEKAARGPVPHSGAVHVVAGSSGKVSNGPLDHPAMLRSFVVAGSVVLDVWDNRLDAVFLSSDGDVLDHFTVIKDPPEPVVSGFEAFPRSGERPLAVRFVDRSTGDPLAWSWDVNGDGAIDAEGPSPTVTYDEPGLYDVRHVATNVLGSDETFAPASICVTDGGPTPTEALVFTDGQALRWSAVPGSTHYELLRGRLSTGLGPDCLSGQLAEPSSLDPQTPPSRDAFYYLARAVDCAGGVGSIDSGGAGQVGLREMRWRPAFPASCPP